MVITRNRIEINSAEQRLIFFDPLIFASNYCYFKLIQESFEVSHIIVDSKIQTMFEIILRKMIIKEISIID